MLTIQLKKKHFKHVSFGSITDCPIARALKERYNTGNVTVGFSFARVGFDHRDLKKHYLDIDFDMDLEKVRKAKSPNTVIREVVFI